MTDPDASLRVSDAERDKTLRTLGEHAAVGRLTLDELEERSSRALAAKTRGELATLTGDLPQEAGQDRPAPAMAKKPVRWMVAIMSGSQRRGRFRAVGSINAIAVMGGDEIDLREAEIEGGELTLNLVAVMGGALAVQFALDHPESSEGIVCAASNSGPGKHEGGYAGLGGPSLSGTRQGFLHVFFDKSLVTDDLVRARFASRLAAGDGYTIQRHLSDHRAPYSPQELARINVPTLFVWCREDEITPLSWGEDYAAAVPGAKLAVLDRCGHLPNIEQPKQFNEAVAAFLGTK